MKPLLRGHFHQAMFFIMLGAGLPLIFKANSKLELFSYAIFILCSLTMFGISSIYHRIHWEPNKRLLMKKLDHAGIYLMIAGTSTPISLLVLSQESSFKFLITIWSVAIIGIIQSIFFVNLPKLISASIYIICGYLVVPYIPEIKNSMSSNSVNLIIFGGIAYTIGGVCYGLKKPILFPKIFGYHEVFHLLVNIGAISHYFAINSIA